MTKRLPALLLAGLLAAGAGACGNEENDESPEEQVESARGSGDDATESDSTDGINRGIPPSAEPPDGVAARPKRVRLFTSRPAAGDVAGVLPCRGHREVQMSPRDGANR